MVDFASAEVLRGQTPGSGLIDLAAEGSKVLKDALGVGSHKLEAPLSDDMPLVPITVGDACEEFRPDSTGGAKGDY